MGAELAEVRIELMKNYVAVLEQGAHNWSAYVPDLPGCVAAGNTRAETEVLIREAIKFHIEGMQIDGLPLPEPTYRSDDSVTVLAVAA